MFFHSSPSLFFYHVALLHTHANHVQLFISPLFFFLQEGQKGYHCQCPPGFVGTHCEIQRNKCDSRPCQNGGKCHAVLGGFVCQCPQEFAGQLCEVSLMINKLKRWIVVDAMTVYMNTNKRILEMHRARLAPRSQTLFKTRGSCQCQSFPSHGKKHGIKPLQSK